MKNAKEKFVELCLKLDEADKATNARKYNQAARLLIKVDTYLGENREDASFLVELLMHENASVRGHAAVRCFDWGINPKQAVAVIEKVYKEATSGNLRIGMGIKLDIISGRLAHLLP